MTPHKPKFTLILDSSQIDCFLECAYKWDYQYHKRLQSINALPNVPMGMGTYGHKLLEIIYKARAEGRPSSAIDEAFAYDIDKMTCRCSHGREKHGCIDQFCDGSCDYHFKCNSIGCDCQNFESIPFPLSAPDREFVRQRVQEYTYMEGPVIPELIPTSPEHVEVGFSHKLYEDTHRLYILEGRIDFLGKIANNCENGWADHKFQSRERNLYLKSIQFRNYSMVTQLPIGVVNYIRFAKKIEKDKTFVRSIISFSRAEMQTWEGQLLRIFHRIENFLKGNIMGEERNWSSCPGKFGYPCEFTKICENWFSPSLIQVTEKMEYRERPEWRPW
jgi:PD-(D/E)XK nuclease superfamily protein